MKVLSLNLHSYQEKRAKEKLEIIANEIIKQEIDVICFSECAQSIFARKINKTMKENNAAYRIQQALQKKDKHYYLSYITTHISYLGYEEGLAILSIHSIVSSFNFFISRQRNFFSTNTRKAMQVIIQIGEVKCAIYNVHLGFDKKNRFVDQFSRIHRFVNSFDLPSIIGGDFNIDSKSHDYQAMMNFGYQDSATILEGAIDEATWNDGKQSSHLDYILLASRIKLLHYSSLFREQRVSDHLGIYASFQL